MYAYVYLRKGFLYLFCYLINLVRKALEEFYPNLKEVQLIDYKVRIVNESEGTGAKVRVLIESTDGNRRWGTVGVSENIIEASWIALADSLIYKLHKDEEEMESN